MVVGDRSRELFPRMLPKRMASVNGLRTRFETGNFRSEAGCWPRSAEFARQIDHAPSCASHGREFVQGMKSALWKRECVRARHGV